MLLTSSQVSILISSGTGTVKKNPLQKINAEIDRLISRCLECAVVLCTAALFLSGYVIQQRTLRDLRAAIISNREPRPSPKIYLPDRFKTSTTELEDGTVVTLDDPRLGSRRRVDANKEDDIIIVRPTFPDEKQQPAQQQQQKMGMLEKAAAAAAAAVAGSRGDMQEDGDGAASTQKPMSRAERRRQIKEEIRKLSEGQEPVYYQRRLW
ncbi:hypothetical protein Hte_009152 [Hypoxylon texense]